MSAFSRLFEEHSCFKLVAELEPDSEVAELEPDSEDDEKMPGLACMSDNSSHPRQCFFCDFSFKK